MQRYRKTIFKYAILLNVPLALWVVCLCLPTIWRYAEQASLRASVRAHPIGMYIEPVSLSELVYAWALIGLSSILLLATLWSVWRNGPWAHWTRIFAFLAVYFFFWSHFGWVAGLLIDDLALNGWNWEAREEANAALKALLYVVVLAALLVYNLSYRPRPPGPEDAFL